MNGTLIIKCKKCKQEFSITDRDISYYKERNWNLPTRCFTCRENKRTFYKTFSQIKKTMRRLSINDALLADKLKTWVNRTQKTK